MGARKEERRRQKTKRAKKGRGRRNRKPKLFKTKQSEEQIRKSEREGGKAQKTGLCRRHKGGWETVLACS